MLGGESIEYTYTSYVHKNEFVSLSILMLCYGHKNEFVSLSILMLCYGRCCAKKLFVDNK